MRLDFDDDGSVSMDDMKLSMVSLYDFLKDFDVIEATTQFKTKLYSDAIKFMQNELEQEKINAEQKGSKQQPEKSDEAAKAAQDIDQSSKKSK